MSDYTNPCVPHGFDDCCNVPEPVLAFEDCLDNPRGGGDVADQCDGAVEYRYPLSGTGRSFVRCDRHWEDRLAIQEGINRRYPDSPFAPAGFDPTYAGERWDEDY